MRPLTGLGIAEAARLAASEAATPARAPASAAPAGLLTTGEAVALVIAETRAWAARAGVACSAAPVADALFRLCARIEVMGEADADPQYRLAVPGSVHVLLPDSAHRLVETELRIAARSGRVLWADSVPEWLRAAGAEAALRLGLERSIVVHVMALPRTERGELVRGESYLAPATGLPVVLLNSAGPPLEGQVAIWRWPRGRAMRWAEGTLVHELIHHCHPTWHESRVQSAIETLYLELEWPVEDVGVHAGGGFHVEN